MDKQTINLGLAGFGLGRALNDILRFAVLQQNTPDELRGRVSSLWMVQAVTGTAIGSMAAGFLGQWLEPGPAPKGARLERRDAATRA